MPQKKKKKKKKTFFFNLIEFTWDYKLTKENLNSTVGLILRDSPGLVSPPKHIHFWGRADCTCKRNKLLLLVGLEPGIFRLTVQHFNH